MAYINGKDVLFGCEVNGTLISDDDLRFLESIKGYASLPFGKENTEYDDTYELYIPEYADAEAFPFAFIPNYHESKVDVQCEVTDLDGRKTYLHSNINLLEATIPKCTVIGAGFVRFCTKLHTVELGALTHSNSLDFGDCPALKNITLGNGVTAPVLDFGDSPLVTKASIQGIIDAYGTVTSATLTLHPTAYALVTEEMFDAATAKNITISAAV